MTNTMNVTEDAIRTGEWAWVMMLADELPEEDLSAEIARSDADAHVAIARGDLAEAARRLHATAQLSPLNAPCVLPHAAQAALWSCDRDAAAVAPEARRSSRA